MRFQTVLFDVDGTLIHSSPGILQTLRETFERMGVDCSGFDLQQYLGPPASAYLCAALPGSGGCGKGSYPVPGAV